MKAETKDEVRRMKCEGLKLLDYGKSFDKLRNRN